MIFKISPPRHPIPDTYRSILPIPILRDRYRYNQLGNKLTYDLEWNNGTSYVYTLDDSDLECQVLHVEVEILKPNWLNGANYLGQHYMDGFFFAMFRRRLSLFREKKVGASLSRF
ncbi:hypothetical protein ACSBR2_027464 [Camellia fascicularis]